MREPIQVEKHDGVQGDVLEDEVDNMIQLVELEAEELVGGIQTSPTKLVLQSIEEVTPCRNRNSHFPCLV